MSICQIIKEPDFCKQTQVIAEKVFYDNNPESELAPGCQQLCKGTVINLYMFGYFWIYTVENVNINKDGIYISGNIVRSTTSLTYINVNASNRVFSSLGIRKEFGKIFSDVSNIRRTTWNCRRCPICATRFIIQKNNGNRTSVYNNSTFFADKEMVQHISSKRHLEHRDVYTNMLYETIKLKLSQDVLIYIVEFL